MKHTEKEARQAIERIATRIQDHNRKTGREVERAAARDYARTIITRHERRHERDQ